MALAMGASSPIVTFHIINQGTSQALALVGTADGARAPAVVQTPVGSQTTKWCLLNDGRITSLACDALTAAAAPHEAAVRAVATSCADELNPLSQCWTIEDSGAITAREHRLVLDIKGFTSAEGAPVITLPRRQINVGTQRWFVVPRQTDAVPPRLQETALQHFRVLHVASGKAVDARADGKAVLFPINAGSHSQCWRLVPHCGGMVLENCDDHKVLATTDPKSRLLGLVDRAALDERGTNVDKMLWQFDVQGFVVSRFDGRVMETSSAQDGAALTTQNRKINVAGLGLMFKSLSTDSQVFRLIPISLNNPTPPSHAMAQGTVEAKDASAPNADALGQDSSLQSLSGDAADGVGAVSKMGVFAEATDNYVGVDTGMGVGMGMGMDDNDDGGNGLDEALTALDNLARKVSAEGEVPDTPNGLDTALHTLQNASARLSRRHSSSPTIEAMQGDSHAGPVDVSPALADPANELAAVPPAKSRAARPKQLPPTPKPYTGSDNTAGNPDGGEDRAQSTPLKELLRERRAQRSQAGALDKGAPSPLAATNPALLRITEEVFKKLPKDEASCISGADLRPTLLQTGLQPNVLAAIWGQVDGDDSGTVSFEELQVVLGLVSQVQAGNEPSVDTMDMTTIAPPQIKGIDVDLSEVWM